MEFRCQKKTILLSMFFAFVTMCLYSQTENLLFDRGTVINGVKWATRNVGIPGHFASSTIESGLFYLWNNKVPFSRYVYETSYQQGSMWYETCNPCPIGWRIPSTEDFITLLDTERVSRKYMVLSQHNEVDNSITIWWEKPLTPTNIQYIIIQRTDSNFQYNSIDTINASQTIYKDYSNNGEKNCFYRILYKTSSGGYIKFSNGLMLNWGTGPVATFDSGPYTYVPGFAYSNKLNGNTYASTCNVKTSGVDWYKLADRVGQWVAIGY